MLAVRQQQVLSQLSPKNVPESSIGSPMADDDDHHHSQQQQHGHHHHHNPLNNNNTINSSNLKYGKKSTSNSALDLTQPNQNDHVGSLHGGTSSTSSNHHRHHHHNNMMMKMMVDEDDGDFDYGRDDENGIDDDGEEEEEEEVIPTSTSCGSAPSTPSTVGSKNRRKGQAFKLNLMKDCPDSDEDSGSHISKQPRRNEQSNDANQQQQQQSSVTHPSTNNEPTSSQSKRDTQSYECKFCDISFGDAVLYTIHMGYHGYNDVFKCNMCGEKCDDRIAFFLHIARNPHN